MFTTFVAKITHDEYKRFFFFTGEAIAIPSAFILASRKVSTMLKLSPEAQT